LRLKDWSNVVYFGPTVNGKENTIFFNPLFSFGTSGIEKNTFVEDLMDLLNTQALEKGVELGTTTRTTLSILMRTGVNFADAYYLYLIKN
jgi:hypothetical protein